MAKIFNLKSYLIAWLRRGSYRVPARNEAKTLARISRGLYRCNICGGSFPNGEFAIDHIIPVIDISTGFTTWDSFINRLFVDATGLQLLCHTCHDEKTKLENKGRLNVRRRKTRSRKTRS